MSRRTAIALLVIAAVLAGATACSAFQDEPTPYPSQVDWETAIKILNTGDVVMVAQLHSLEVFLTMKDGSEIRTVEPTIDAIFEEVEKCGQPCSGIALATE